MGLKTKLVKISQKYPEQRHWILWGKTITKFNKKIIQFSSVQFTGRNNFYLCSLVIGLLCSSQEFAISLCLLNGESRYSTSNERRNPVVDSVCSECIANLVFSYLNTTQTRRTREFRCAFEDRRSLFGISVRSFVVSLTSKFVVRHRRETGIRSLVQCT